MTDMELAEEIERILVEYHRAVELDDASLLPKIMSRWCDLFFKPGASAIIAALRRWPERPPSGEMVMVPREPTEKMIRAGIREGDSDADWKSCYHAMLSAAEASKEAK